MAEAGGGRAGETGYEFALDGLLDNLFASLLNSPSTPTALRVDTAAVGAELRKIPLAQRLGVDEEWLGTELAKLCDGKEKSGATGVIASTPPPAAVAPTKKVSTADEEDIDAILATGPRIESGGPAIAAPAAPAASAAATPAAVTPEQEDLEAWLDSVL